jgi:predicted DCC family thiol-disulfide oxidoreductase YuxK
VRSSVQVVNPPAKPLLLYDGDCNFCARWIRRWRSVTGEAVDYLAFQDASVGTRFPELSREQLETAVHLLEPDGSVFTGAEAALRALAHNPKEQWLLDWYSHSQLFARVSERLYRFVAEHRRFFSILTRLGWGEHVEAPTHYLARWVFPRSMGLIYLFAFVSLWVQVGGLIGSNGVEPAKMTMESVTQQSRDGAWLRYHEFPTLCWFSASDSFLNAQCAAGVILAVLLIVGVAPALCLFLLWMIYLSLCTIGREFLSFQWDILLLETGFLAIFVAPLQFRPRLWRCPPPSGIALWLLRWLLFRLMFESGCVKLVSGDPTWRNFTALNYHYETQPLPTWIGWYAHQLPWWFQKTSTALMFGIELVIPFLIFTPRRLRHFACGTLIVLQVFILLTGNYCFFNLLTIALCVTLLDDAAMGSVVRKLGKKCAGETPALPGPALPGWRWPRQITVPLACMVLVLSVIQLAQTFRERVPWPAPLRGLYGWLAPFRTFNSYGLFAVMTTNRLEIIVQGSNDGTNWLDYEFKYKPGELKRRPGFVEPHQPRLDWQMWFAALGDYKQNSWFVNFCIRLLQGSPEVLGLLKRNPFGKAPPRYIRAVVYEYHFTDFATRRRTGEWWRRELKGRYLPVISLRQE